MGATFIITVLGLLFSLWNVLDLFFKIPRYANIIIGILPLPFTLFSILTNFWNFYMEGNSRVLILWEFLYQTLLGDYYMKYQLKMWLKGKSIYCNPMSPRKIFNSWEYVFIESVDEMKGVDQDFNGILYHIANEIEHSNIKFSIERRNKSTYEGSFINLEGDVEYENWIYSEVNVEDNSDERSFYPLSIYCEAKHNNYNIKAEYKVSSESNNKENISGMLSIIITHPDGSNQIMKLGDKKMDYISKMFYVISNYPEAGILGDIRGFHVRRGFIILHSINILDCIDMICKGKRLFRRHIATENRPVVVEGVNDNLFDLRGKLSDMMLYESKCLMMFKYCLPLYGKDFSIVIIEYIKASEHVKSIREYSDIIKGSKYPIDGLGNWQNKRLKKDVSYLMTTTTEKYIRYLDKVKPSEIAQSIIKSFNEGKDIYYENYLNYIDESNCMPFVPRFYKKNVDYKSTLETKLKYIANRAFSSKFMRESKKKDFEEKKKKPIVNNEISRADTYSAEGKPALNKLMDIDGYISKLDEEKLKLSNKLKGKSSNVNERKNILDQMKDIVKAMRYISWYKRFLGVDFSEVSLKDSDILINEVPFYLYPIYKDFMLKDEKDRSSDKKEREAEIHENLSKKRREEAEVINSKQKNLNKEWKVVKGNKKMSEKVFVAAKTKIKDDNYYNCIKDINEEELRSVAVGFIGFVYGRYNPSRLSKCSPWEKKKTSSSKFIYGVRSLIKKTLAQNIHVYEEHEKEKKEESKEDIKVTVKIEELKSKCKRVHEGSRYNSVKDRMNKLACKTDKISLLGLKVVQIKHGVRVPEIFSKEAKVCCKEMKRRIKNWVTSREHMLIPSRPDMHISEVFRMRTYSMIKKKRQEENVDLNFRPMKRLKKT